MSHSASLSHYRAALTAPGAVAPALASIIGRLPIAMVGLALLFYVQRTTGSFAVAGVVSAAALVGVAVGSVVQGRVIDRFGATRPLLAVSVVFAAVVTVAVTAVESRAGAPMLVALALAVGLTEPMVGSSSRALWGRLLPAGPVRNAGYAYEAISMEVFFILGPGLAGVLALSDWWAGTGVVVGAASMVVGAVVFALTPAVRAWGPARSGSRSHLGPLGALGTPGMRTVTIAAFGFGLTIGFVEVGVPAAATLAGKAAIGGVLLSLWSVSSVLAGVAYGVRPWPRPLHLRPPVLLFGFALLLPLLAVPSSLVGLGVALLVVGVLITPQATTHSTMIDVVAPPGTSTEAFGWVVTAVTLGLAAGQSASGALVEASGPGAAFLAGSLGGLLVAAVVWARRHTMRVPQRVEEPVPVAAGVRS
ncbi:MAG TPA: MFS transporter [Pseudonocardiaceae bacterium]